MNRILGKKEVPSVGLGCMGMSEFYGATDDEQSLVTLNMAYDYGYRHYDTADMYGLGHNEALLGRFIKQLGTRREDVSIASKVGIQRDSANKFSISVDGRKEYIIQACNESLQRLGTDYLDLYYLHRVDPKVPLEESLEALEVLMQQGKIRSVGLCEVSAETIVKANTLLPISAVQSEYSLWSRDVEENVLPTCVELGVAFVAFSPLGRGFLTGNIDKNFMNSVDAEQDFRARLPRFNAENIDANAALVAQLKQISDELGLQTSQMALAWILAKAPNIHIIPGTKKPAYLLQNFESQKVQLSADVIARLDSIFAPGSVKGTRYPQAIASHSNS